MPATLVLVLGRLRSATLRNHDRTDPSVFDALAAQAAPNQGAGADVGRLHKGLFRRQCARLDDRTGADHALPPQPYPAHGRGAPARPLGLATMCAAGPFPPFFERPPWLTGDLQTLRNMIRRPFHDLAPWPERRLELPLADGDRLVAHSHRPDGAVSGVVILIHGLGGGADSVYVRATARHLLLNGYAVIRLNLRGAGASAPLCRSQPRLSGVLGRPPEGRCAGRARRERRRSGARGPHGPRVR